MTQDRRVKVGRDAIGSVFVSGDHARVEVGRTDVSSKESLATDETIVYQTIAEKINITFGPYASPEAINEAHKKLMFEYIEEALKKAKAT